MVASLGMIVQRGAMGLVDLGPYTLPGYLFVTMNNVAKLSHPGKGAISQGY